MQGTINYIISATDKLTPVLNKIAKTAASLNMSNMKMPSMPASISSFDLLSKATLSTKSPISSKGIEKAAMAFSGLNSAIAPTGRGIESITKNMDKLGSSVERAQKAIENLNRTEIKLKGTDKVKSFSDNMDQMYQKSRRLREVGTSAFLPISAGLIALPTLGLKSALAFEQLDISFETMLGSKEKAAQMIADMRKYALETPFEYQDVAESVRTLIPAGVKQDKLMPYIKLIGTVAAGTTRDIQRLANTMSGIFSQGKINGQDLKEFKTAGINLADALGMKQEEFQKRVTKGLITADMVMKAFKNMTSEGGLFYGAMDKYANSLNGSFSRLSESLTIISAQFGKDFAESINIQDKVTALTNGLGKLSEWMKGLSPTTKAFISWVIVLGAAFAPIIMAVGQLGMAIFFIAKSLAILKVAMLGAFIPVLIVLAKVIAATEMFTRVYYGMKYAIGSVTGNELMKEVAVARMGSGLRTLDLLNINDSMIGSEIGNIMTNSIKGNQLSPQSINLNNSRRMSAIPTNNDLGTAKILVDFANAPQGTRVTTEQERSSKVNLGTSMSYAY